MSGEHGGLPAQLPFDIRIGDDLSAVAPGVAIGALLFEGVQAGPAGPELTEALAREAAEAAARLGEGGVTALPGVAGWRRVLKALGTDPARYRPSSEALLRRAVQGKPLPAVNAVVDVNNLVSLRSGLPIGLYDADRLQGPVLTFGAGRPGEVYLALSGREIETAGKPVLRDGAGVCGGPLTDSERTKVTEGTRRALMLLYAPPGFPAADLEAAVDQAAALMVRHAGGRVAARRRV
ncbi:B3/B4 domain-containing protein [Caldinitratiruptor microaerophilus]|uniref:B3/B4 tRNA-binding domain-containing protein n=1 Tax=Caldinitratiruptor microaerophilus TaxID=671077 RepID=A0AA35G902_9FIRM|nr:phenylalanine--tRNA ligase beta subunit-related protein [Caldinitratiruptor microaerophilus]BDG61596.1 hypothetical protein caldi_26860 [Caldinitratiruptor microaerophilus]